MLNRTKAYISASIILWLLIITISAVWNVAQARSNQEQIYLETGRAFFNQVLITREWNSKHGGVYVAVTADTQPNPYLDVSNRDVVTTSGQQLTLINPAYMTRLIAELAAEKNDVQFHITSRNPIRPANAAQEWESLALAGFEEKTLKEYHGYYDNGKYTVFRFMAPLITQESCLKCHEKQGYKVGDVRGGISVTFPVRLNQPWALIFSHLLIGSAGSALIFVYGKKLERNMLVLENLSNIDGLTQIHNRRYFDESLAREYSYSRRNGIHLAVALCDIDNFKAFNDCYGHQAGDECLKKVAETLSSVLKRPGDLVARYGGEEFGIILPFTSPAGALAIANMLRAKIESLEIPHKDSTTGSFVTISIGVAFYQGEEISRETLLSLADQSLYLAKSNGRNLVMPMYESGTVNSRLN